MDRRHSVVISGRMEIPETRGATLSGVLRMLSGTPFTIQDTNIDADQNGILFDPLPAGTYSGTSADSMQNVENKGGRNGARGPGFMQLDLRAGCPGQTGFITENARHVRGRVQRHQPRELYESKRRPPEMPPTSSD